MRKLKLFLACLLMAVLSIGQVWAATTETYTFASRTWTATNSADEEANWVSVTQGSGFTSDQGIQLYGGNTSQGTSPDSFDNIEEIVIHYCCNSKKGYGTISVQVGDGTAKEFSITKPSSGGTTLKTNSFSFDPKESGVVTIVMNSSENSIYLHSVDIIYTPAGGGDPIPVLQSIAVSNNPTTTTYEEGNVFDVTGLIVTGTYDIGDPAAITEGITWKARTNALSDDAVALANYHLTKGQTSLQVQATVSGKTSDWYTVSGLTVNEHIVTPGTYSITPNNAFWGTSYSGTNANAASTLSGSQNDISLLLTKSGSNLYVNDSQTRVYENHTLQFSVPAGYVITTISFTADGSNWAGTHTASVGEMTDNKNWSGSAQSVTITFKGKCRVKGISVTYEAYVAPTTYAVTLAAPTNGTLAVKDGNEAITSGDEFVSGKTLTVVATPNDGFKLDGIKVIETGSDPENDVTSTVLAGTTLTVPAYAVTVSATFSANEAPFATLTLSEIGEETVYYDDDSKHEGDVVSLPLTAASCSKVFRGWDPDENRTTAPTYAPGASFTLGASASNKLYAVYATPIVDTESEPELAQTLQYDTWTYAGGTTTDKSSYRLFGNGAYVESAEFDLSLLAKVKVFGGTFGGQDTYKTGTIGDGSQKWKDITMTGTVNAKEHAFTDGAALSGTGKLYVKSTCGNGTDQGLRISKVEIYTYGTTYGDYSTACLAKVDAPTFPVEQKEYTAAQNITISVVEGATIHYTTDGSLPTSASPIYSEPIALSTRGEYVIKAIAVKDGFANSDVVTAHYSINLPFANLADLVAAELADGSEVIVSFADEVITYKGSKYISLTTKDANDNTIQIYHSSAEMPDWVVGGKVSATAKRFTWTLFGESQWELVPVGEFAWATGLAYTAPKTVSSVVVTGKPNKDVYTVGETFDPAGLTVTVNYSDKTSEVNPPVGVTFTTDPANGKMALEQTSIKVKATYNTVTSEDWFTVGDLTVNDLEIKTIAEFIAAEGGRCYLIGTVSNIANTTYGNFDLTDASGSIYVFGCLDTEGASKNFASLDVVEDDYIKVIADVYEYYNNETHEAKNVQFVEELEKPDVPVTSVSVANATVKINKTVQLAATVLPINASNKNVTWSVKEGSEAYAEVSATGVVTGKAEGNAVIVATSVADNTKFGECTVTVTGGINFAAGDFVLVEDAAELTEGTYVIVASAGENNVAMKYHAGNSDGNHKGKAAVKEGKYLHYDADFGVYEIKDYVVEEVKQGISFYNENAENYFALPGNSNQLKTSTEQNNNSSWTAAVSEGVTTLTNKALTTRTLRYNPNNGSPVFACYTTGQQPIALYKYVTPAAYRVYYNDNVAEEEIEVPAYQSVNGENKVTITAVVPARDGFLFGGWKDGENNVYEAGVEYTLSGDITLYAQWTTATVSTLSYNPNGGTLIGGETAIADAEVAEGTNLTIAANVYEKGDNFVFAGWQLGDDVYQPGDPFEMPATDVEFVAKWDAVEVSDYALVTDLAQLQAGDKIIIVAANLDFAAGAQAGTYRESVAIGKTASKNNLVLAGYDAPTEFTLGISEGKYSFNDGTGYMYEEEAKKVKTQANPYYWTISIDGDAIATISATNELRYNSSSPRFTTYESGQQTLQLYRKPGDAPTPDYETVRSGLEINRYYTVCLPKKVTAIKGASFWTLNNKSQDGAVAYLEEETNNLPFAAGKPFIIQATADKLEVVYEGDATNVAGTNGALHGTLVYMDATALDAAGGSNVYMLFSNELRPVGDDNHLDANRAYVKLNELNAVSEAPQGAPGKRVRAMPMQPQVATGMDALNASDAPVKVLINGQLFIIRGEKMFDAKGQLVK